MFTANGLSVYAGEHRLLDSLSFALAAGQCVALIGANGAGKSSLLRTLSGEYQHERGIRVQGGLQFSGQALADWSLPDLAQRRSMLMQSHEDSTLRVEELLALGAYPHGGLNHEQGALWQQLLADWQLEKLRDRAFHSLSGGERQRVHLARTDLQLRLQANPAARCWLLDEPLTGLDLPHQQLLRERLRASAQAGALLVFSVHDVNFALRLADTILALRDGKLLYAGPAADFAQTDLLEAVYATAFTCVQHPVDGLPLVFPL